MTSMLPWQRWLLDEHDGDVANGNKLPNSTTDSYRQQSFPLGTPSGWWKVQQKRSTHSSSQLDHRGACHQGRVITDVYDIMVSIWKSKVNNHCTTKTRPARNNVLPIVHALRSITWQRSNKLQRQLHHSIRHKLRILVVLITQFRQIVHFGPFSHSRSHISAIAENKD